jgi:hypothetical protein
MHTLEQARIGWVMFLHDLLAICRLALMLSSVDSRPLARIISPVRTS